jgi:UDPglucose 6-dehydrogenase
VPRSVGDIVVAGAGYVGLTTGACLASLGYDVWCADIDSVKVARLQEGVVDIHEPPLVRMVADALEAGRLRFVTSSRAALEELRRSGRPCEAVIVCVSTPGGVGGVADLSALESVIEDVRDVLPAGAIMVNKSTVPVGTAERTAVLLDRPDVSVVSNPEFLRMGFGVHDFLHPDRIVIGSDAPEAAERIAALYAEIDAPKLMTDWASAELIKYAANGFLATKLSYINAIAELCDRLGADVFDVSAGVGSDNRIGCNYLSPGPGWGGSCLPKDAQALLWLSDSVDFDFQLLRATVETNALQSRRIAEMVKSAVTGDGLGSLADSRITLLGLTFKAFTGDLRESPALAVAAQLRESGAELCAFDPAVPVRGAGPLQENLLTVASDPYVAAYNADALVILTDWPEFRDLDWPRLASVVRRPIVVDARNVVDPEVLQRSGFSYSVAGRAHL